jgi:hypothetical protein
VPSRGSLDSTGLHEGHLDVQSQDRVQPLPYVLRECDHISHDIRKHLLGDFEANLDVVEPVFAVYHDQVVRSDALDLEQHVLYLAGKHVDPSDDEHVVGPLSDLAHARESAAALTRGPIDDREVVSAVAKHREGLFRERGDDQFSLLALARNSPLTGSTSSTRKWSSLM